MIQRPFFGFIKPKLMYPVTEVGEKVSLTDISLPNQITLLHNISKNSEGGCLVQTGDKVTTGQKVAVLDGDNGYIISPVTGTISDISEYTGYLGKIYLSIRINTDKDEQISSEFKELSEDVNSLTAFDYLANIPGVLDMSSICRNENPLETIVISGVDKDLLVSTNRFIVTTECEELNMGIEYLRRISKSARIVMTVTNDLIEYVKDIDAEIAVIQPIYPEALPEIIMKNVLGKTVPAGMGCEDVGVGFVNAEAVAALGKASGKGEIPVNKVLTVLDKDQKSVIVKARIGTSIKDILDTLHIQTETGDRIVVGGPMMGISVFNEDMPVMRDTDAIMVQGGDQIVESSDTPCINCGECVRICPANIPVNMLVRLLENSLYDEAVDQYDLNSCIECGLCAYVCTARIPVFHYIMLGKYELEKIKSVEEPNA